MLKTLSPVPGIRSDPVRDLSTAFFFSFFFSFSSVVLFLSKFVFQLLSLSPLFLHTHIYEYIKAFFFVVVVVYNNGAEREARASHGDGPIFFFGLCPSYSSVLLPLLFRLLIGRFTGESVCVVFFFIFIFSIYKITKPFLLLYTSHLCSPS